ncbi:adenosylcobinamide amidohydrolase [Methanoregula sp.]|uniref:adenosylcobinamide amidohydrolase n=1 Tax=Methanoregula sp. TaxID=2052170 RepID=UPI002B8BC5FB|nr:adenosylcobinamide amidohydrolase [Methanoregula sp.]HVP96489.1 adenosylcobinamide amidohydrolase [Methanoregula sp.]
MRYYQDSQTLFIRGVFRAASTGIAGGIRDITTLFNHTVLPGWDHAHPEKEIELVAAAAGTGSPVFGLLTAVPIRHLFVLQYDFITVFITAGARPEQEVKGAGTINIIAYSSEGMEDAALLEMILVATEAKAEALLAAGLGSGTSTDAVIAACEGETKHRFAGRVTEPGRRVREAVLRGVPEALRRYRRGAVKEGPAFFIYSRFEGGHWVEWSPVNCPYYPCHFAGQRCDFCYCPFYPCKDETLGEWSKSASNGRVWNCSRCTLLHEPAIADYLKRYPDAPREELVRYRKQQKEKIIP